MRSLFLNHYAKIKSKRHKAKRERRRRKEKLGQVVSLRTDPIFAVGFAVKRVLVWRSEETPLVSRQAHARIPKQ